MVYRIFVEKRPGMFPEAANLLKDQFIEAVNTTSATQACEKRTVIATGVDAAPYLKALVGMAKQKWPEELHQADDFPRTASGKVQKFQVRKDIATST